MRYEIIYVYIKANNGPSSSPTPPYAGDRSHRHSTKSTIISRGGQQSCMVVAPSAGSMASSSSRSGCGRRTPRVFRHQPHVLHCASTTSRW